MTPPGPAGPGEQRGASEAECGTFLLPDARGDPEGGGISLV